MGHRAEKQMYGSVKAFRRIKDAEKPRWQPPKIGVVDDNGNRKWQPRHRKDS